LGPYQERTDPVDTPSLTDERDAALSRLKAIAAQIPASALPARPVTPTPPTAYPDNNPKTAQGVKKPALSTVPLPFIVELMAAHKNGADKYGPLNWRQAEISASVYFDAMFRHLIAWFDGEDRAEDSGINHLAHIAAGAAIAFDAMANGKFIDDRPKTGLVTTMLKEYTNV
jgi:hypothetical protein